MVESAQVCKNRGQGWVAGVYTGACRRFPGFRKVTRRLMYQLLARYYQRRDWTFMNYGYAPLASDAELLELEEADEYNRYCIQLYHHVASAADLAGQQVLEVGSGRGGGSYYMKRYLRPAEMVGLDYSEQAVELCQRLYDLPGLRFVHGDAEDLPFDDASFDAVVNVESSHCYGSVPDFLRETVRVLRPGGHFLFADFREGEDLTVLHKRLVGTGMEVLRRQVITPHVVAALEKDNARKVAQVRAGAPRWLVGIMSEFIGVPGSRIHNLFSNGDVTYVSYTLRKAM